MVSYPYKFPKIIDPDFGAQTRVSTVMDSDTSA
jgi:hypothetical protein